MKGKLLKIWLLGFIVGLGAGILFILLNLPK